MTLFDFTARHSKAVWATHMDAQRVDAPFTWAQVVRRHWLAKVIYHSVIDELGRSGPVWEDASAAVKDQYIELANDIIHEQTR